MRSINRKSGATFDVVNVLAACYTMRHKAMMENGTRQNPFQRAGGWCEPEGHSVFNSLLSLPPETWNLD